MKKRKQGVIWLFAGIMFLLAWGGWSGSPAVAGDIKEIRDRGVLRHLGIPYAHFVRFEEGRLDGLDVELMQHFARHLGVRYEWVPTSWSDGLGDLTGHRVEPVGDDVRRLGNTDIKGDILANGLTILPWREKVVDYSSPTFPTGVWLVAHADAAIKPITPSGDFQTDLRQVRKLLKGRSILAMEKTCLDPDLYRLNETGADIRLYTASENLGELAPAVIQGAADATLLDIPDALVALQKWPGKVKVIGPVSPAQFMGVVFAKGSTDLLEEFNRFFHIIWQNGTYHRLVEKYYPAVFLYLDSFFKIDPFIGKEGDAARIRSYYEENK